MAKHAILSASASHRWLNCPPCVELEKGFENKTSPEAAEGTLAHELGELSLRYQLEELTKRSYDSKVKKLITNNELYSEDMPDYVEIYTDVCMEKVAAARATTPDAIAIVEQKLNFSEWVPDGFGTGDFVIIADGTMEICDLKYGKGVPVSAIGNSQMRLYALGAITEFSFLYDIQNVKMTIIQPRLDSISTDEMTVDDLIKWANEYVKPRAELAIKGEGELCVGEHCTFCRAKAVCRAQEEYNMELAKYEFAEGKLLGKEEIADILGRVDDLVSWATKVQAYALEQALNGVDYPGYKVVEGRSNRRYTDEIKVGEILIGQGFSEEKIYKPKAIEGLTNMEKLVGKKKLAELIGEYIEKPPGKPTLAPESDKREPYNTAKSDFE